nr:hypothetical protein [Tanacetum cinerariifolium]
MMELVMHTEKNDVVFHTEKTGMLRLVFEINVGGMTADVVDKNDVVFHTEKTGMLRLMFEIDVGGMTADVVDKVTCSFDDLQLNPVDLKCVHTLTKPHLHDIHVLPNRHEVDQHNPEYFFCLVTPFSSTVSQRSGPFSTDSSIIRPCYLFNIYSSILLFHESYMSFANIGGRLSAPDIIALSARLVILKFVM